MNRHTRRDFVKLAGGAAALGAMPGLSGVGRSSPFTDPAQRETGGSRRTYPFDLGIASYTFRSFPVDQAIAMTARMRVKKITLKDMHLPMTVTPEDLAAVREKLKAAGVELSSLGVVYM